MHKIRKILLGFALTTTIFLSGLVVAHADHSENPSLQVSPQSHDFGEIQQEEGVVSTTFEVTNNTEEAITINRLSTSCGCTTAEMSLEDLAPGETRTLKVTFDPMVHPDQLGKIERVVYLQTSDTHTPEIEIDLTGNVVGKGTAPPVPSTEKTEIKQSNSNLQAIVFFNEACQDCGELVNKKYPALFGEYNIEVDRRDYINERENRKELTKFNEKWGIPFELQSHIEAFVGENLLIGGHVPEATIRYLLENPDSYEKLLVYQDKMHGEESDYKVWDFNGEIKTYDIDEPITTFLTEHKKSKIPKIKSSNNFWALWAVITSSAFLDGINPCAIAVLLFFIAFLFSIKKTKKSIWKMGFVYIFAIFLAYLLIGVGIAQAIIISGAPHLMAYVGAYFVIGLGVIQLLSLVFPKFPIKLKIPVNTKAVMEKWLFKATLPAAFIGGFIVGLCTFPCSGGIYVAIIGMLASSQTYTQGLGWMLWYNLIFIAPLIIILLLAANPKTTEKLQKWERKESKKSKAIIGATMIALGLIIIFFFTN